MSDKAYKKAHEKVSEEVKKLAHSSDDNAQFMQLQKYNSVVAGLHEYYCISTEVSHDFSRLAFSINKQLRNRLKGDLSKKGQLRNGFIKEKYGASRQMRFLHDVRWFHWDMSSQRMPSIKGNPSINIRSKVGNRFIRILQSTQRQCYG